jgi:hypothetical protein
MRWVISIVASIIVVTAAAIPARDVAAGEQQGAGRVTATILADTDGDGQVSEGDEPAVTLVELESPGRPLVSVFNDASGSFDLRNIPEGRYTLVVWWSPGFIEPATTAPTNPGRLEIPLDVAADGVVASPGPGFEVILVNALPEGLTPYPVRTGVSPGEIATGVVDVAAAYAAAAPTPAPPVDLPTAGAGPGGGTDPPMGHLALLAATLVAGLAAAVTWGRRHA